MDTGERKETDDIETGKDPEQIPNGPPNKPSNTRYSGQATKAGNPFAGSTPSATKHSMRDENMARPAGCRSPKTVFKGGGQNRPLSTDADSLAQSDSAPEIQIRPHQERCHSAGDAPHRTNNDEDALITIPLCTSQAEQEALLHAMPQPPVTKDSLEELELSYIQSNITLRIDINFDHDLHFTPISGDKGEFKRVEARKYWLSLESELRIVYRHSLLVPCEACDERISSSDDSQLVKARLPTFRSRLPVLFQKLKELLIILVPERDADQVRQYLDVPLLLQEVNNGLLDIVRLAQWLDVLLTSHCAPMRDISAHQMAEKIRQGVERGDTQTLVGGIEMLFHILEAMKLDVANHQIRSFRFLLIDDTVTFQQDFFRSKINQGDLHVGPSREWYYAALEKHRRCPVEGQTPRSLPLVTLVHGMLEVCVWQDLELPATFKYDHKRLKEIRVEVQDFIHLDMCIQVFNKLIAELSATRPNIVSDRQLIETRALLRNRVMDITDGNPDDMSQIWLQYADAIAVELSRAASQLQSGPGVPIPAAMIAQTTKDLTKMFTSEHHHHHRAKRLLLWIEQEAQKHGSRFQNMTTQDISHSQKQWRQLRAQRYTWRLIPEVEDIARRLAHIATIHWRVWAELAYMESEDSGYCTGRDETDTNSISGEDYSTVTDGPIDYVQHHFEADSPRR